MSILERADEIEQDFYELKSQELGPKATKDEIIAAVTRAIKELSERHYGSH